MKTKQRIVNTLTLGAFVAHETLLQCFLCRKVYHSEELSQLISAHSHFGYDVIVYIGKGLFIDHQSDSAIQQALKEKNIIISLREIAYLGKKFIIYLALCHQESQGDIKKLMQSNGGYILHLDGTCENDSPMLISSIDGLSRIVLDNIKAPSENIIQLQPFLERIKEAYGDPIAAVHDMRHSIINAVENVFPKTKDFICHYHFLRDLGKDLFSLEHSNIKRYLKTFKTRNMLRKIARELKYFIESDDKHKACLEQYLSSKDFEKANIALLPAVSFYVTLIWVLECQCQSNGYGFPFDRPELDFYTRLEEAYPTIKALQKSLPKESPKLSLMQLVKPLRDQAMQQTLKLINKKINVFDKLREAMRIALPDSQAGLNDEGDNDIKTIKAQVKYFRESREIKDLATHYTAFRKMVKQIDKYWDKLFADPVTIKVNEIEMTILPQRTNNLMERFFRDFKRGERKKTGTSSLSKKLKAMLADTPLVKNLQNPVYMNIILNGKSTLAERFSEIDIKLVREMQKQKDESSRKYPKGMAKILSLPHLPSKIAEIGAKVEVAA